MPIAVIRIGINKQSKDAPLVLPEGDRVVVASGGKPTMTVIKARIGLWQINQQGIKVLLQGLKLIIRRGVKVFYINESNGVRNGHKLSMKRLKQGLNKRAGELFGFLINPQRHHPVNVSISPAILINKG